MSLVFGIAHRAPSQPLRTAFDALVAELARVVGLAITPAYAESYEELTAHFVEGKISLAWLPPIPYIALERAHVAVPLVGHHRAGDARFYEAVLITRGDADISSATDIRGTRVAWVDALSASGYALPRIRLAALGIDPRTAFAQERFLGSHEAAVRAVVGKTADLAGTYARVDPQGRVIQGSWSSIEGAADAIHVFMSFGAIPTDVTAARMALPEPIREELARGLLMVAREPEGAALVRTVFGVDELSPWITAMYDPLRRALAQAGEQGLLGAIDTLEIARL
jgi:phosphonate transport system substrate-binding protein